MTLKDSENRGASEPELKGFWLYVATLCSVTALLVALVDSRVSAMEPETVNQEALEKTWYKHSQATARWLFMDVYQASLYSKQKPLQKSDFLNDETPLLLKLCYHRPIDKQRMIEAADRVLPKNLEKEVRRAVENLHSAYRSVKEGDCYRLKHQPQTGTKLIWNDQTLFHTNVRGFKKAYFGIWLGENPLSEELKKDLLKGDESIYITE